MEIRSKHEFYRLWNAGVLGNRLQQWETAQDAYNSRIPLVGFREVGRGGGGIHRVVKRKDILLEARSWVKMGRKYAIGEAAPDHRVILQGEICRILGGWFGTLGVRTKMRMRESMAAGLLLPCYGVQIVDLLNRFMDPSSRDDLEGLLELYPDATVEFACYEMMVGQLPGRNTIFWEVRNY